MRRLALYSLLFALYLVSTVPVGLFIYSLKTEVGFDIFRDGGFYAYMRCLSTSSPVVRTKAAAAPASEAPQRCEPTKGDEAPLPAPARLEDTSRPNEKRSREGAKEQCTLEAARLGKAASLWCAGL